jgi:RNA-directed DNA polymerase
MACLGLTLNETKTKLQEARRESFDFLGYTFGPQRHGKDGREYLGASPSQKSVARLRKKVNDVLTPRNTEPWPEVRTRLNRLLRGWTGSFSYGSLRRAYQAIDHHVATRVRQFLGRRREEPTRGTRALPDDVIFGPLGVLRLRHVPPAARPRAWR